MDIGIRSGKSADQISRDLRQYLNNPDKLFRRVRNQYGNLVLSKNAQDYHLGQGVYRSSYKNARRLAATETNIAYRTADHDRWQELDMVVGIEVRLSNNHTIKDSKGKSKKLEDMCDELAGKYPKDFKFTGWHPNCRCYAVPILKTNEEVIEDNKRILRGEKPLTPSKSQNYVGDKDLPQGFRDWVTNNSGRIEIARNRGTLPYFIKDNEDMVNRVMEEANSGNMTIIKPDGNAFTQERKDNALWDTSGGEEADKALFDGASKAWQSATEAEKKEAFGYTENESTYNWPIYGKEKMTDWKAEDIQNLTSYVSKSKTPCDMWVQRGDNEGLSIIEARLKAMDPTATMPTNLQQLVGMEMKQNAFLSTSVAKGKGFGAPVILNIYVPKGMQAAYLEPFSYFNKNSQGSQWDGEFHATKFSDEQELLLQRGSVMRITKVSRTGGKIYIDCELLRQEIDDDLLRY